MILYNHQIYRWFRQRGLLRVFRAGDGQEQEEERVVERRGHVAIVGVNALGRRIIDALMERGERVLAIDTDRRKLLDVRCETMIGNVDHLAVFNEAGLRQAKLVVSTLQIEDVNRLLAYRCRTCGVPVAIHGFDQAVMRELEDLGVDYIIETKGEAVRLIAAELQKAGAL
jgi:Trk K+ transport system NAD-binding subunit